jgi:hypothetical protein
MSDTEFLLNLENELIESMRIGDIQKLDDFLHNDLLFAIPNGETVTKEMDLNNFKKNLIKIDLIELVESESVVIEDNGIVCGKINMKGSFNEEPFEGTFKYLRVWKSFGENWKVIGGAGIHLSRAERV